MGDNTGINWTDATWNPVTGCAKVSAGCKHCYAERDWSRLSANPKTVYFGRQFTDVAVHPERLDQPLRWNRPRKIFVNSMSDLFHPDVPEDFILKVFRVMAQTQQHQFQVLTKRPERMREVLSRWKADGVALLEVHGSVLPNVWLGVTVEDQASADLRVPLLLDTPAALRFLSMEPLLENVDISFALGWARTRNGNWVAGRGIDWVIVGGESGPKARPMDPLNALIVQDRCAKAGVPFVFKQWGAWVPEMEILRDHPERFEKMVKLDKEYMRSGVWMYRVPGAWDNALLDGVAHIAEPFWND